MVKNREEKSVNHELLSVEDVARRWNKTSSTVYGLRYRGEGPPAIRIGRTLRFRLTDVEAWETERRDGGGPRAA